MIGTSQANDSVSAVRDTITRLGPPQGLRTYVTGPGATISDEFAAIDRQLLRITAATVGLILLLLLVVYRSPVGAAIPLMSVGTAIAVARPIIAALGECRARRGVAVLRRAAGRDDAWRRHRLRDLSDRPLPRGSGSRPCPGRITGGRLSWRRPGDRGIGPHDRGGVGVPELRTGRRVPAAPEFLAR